MPRCHIKIGLAMLVGFFILFLVPLHDGHEMPAVSFLKPPTLPSTYTSYVNALIVEECGIHLAAALYDPCFFHATIEPRQKGRPSTLLSGEIDPTSLLLSGAPAKGKDGVTSPAMATIPSRLVLLKQVTSLALGRLAHDGRLGDNWAAGYTFDHNNGSEPHQRKLYLRPIRATIRALVEHSLSYLQFVIDSADRMPELVALAREFGHDGVPSRHPVIDARYDPLLVYLQMLEVVGPTDPTSCPCDEAAHELLRHSQRLRTAAQTTLPTSAPSGLRAHYIDLLVASGSAFSAILRSADSSPVAKSLLHILGFSTELWRNRVAAIRAAIHHLRNDPMVATSRAMAVRGQSALQYFSNNKLNYWDREASKKIGRFWTSVRPVLGCTSTMKLCDEPDGCRYICNFDFILRAGTRTVDHQAIGIGSNNEYDWELGTLDAFRRAKLAAPLSEPPNRLGKLTIFDCTLPEWRPPAMLTDGLLEFGHSSHCLASENSSIATKHNALTFAGLRQFIQSRRYPIYGSQTPLSLSPDFSTFDEVTFLKCDIEWSEHEMLPQFLLEELRDLASRAKNRECTSNLVYFDEDAKNSLTASQFMLELHMYGSDVDQALTAHHTVLQLYAKGFMLYAQEINPSNSRCYELAFVHYRNFIRSEVWQSGLSV